MERFKEGDVVRCVEPFLTRLRAGAVYTVRETIKCGQYQYLRFDTREVWQISRFIKATRLDAIVFKSLRRPLRKGEHDDVNE